jgi:hypothetical protein
VQHPAWTLCSGHRVRFAGSEVKAFDRVNPGVHIHWQLKMASYLTAYPRISLRAISFVNLTQHGSSTGRWRTSPPTPHSAATAQLGSPTLAPSDGTRRPTSEHSRASPMVLQLLPHSIVCLQASNSASCTGLQTHVADEHDRAYDLAGTAGEVAARSHTAAQPYQHGCLAGALLHTLERPLIRSKAGMIHERAGVLGKHPSAAAAAHALQAATCRRNSITQRSSGCRAS